MAESYKRTRIIPASTGVTYGSYVGFINGATAQMVGLASPFLGTTLNAATNAYGITYYGSTLGSLAKVSVGPSQLVPVHVSAIIPQTYDVIGLIS